MTKVVYPHLESLSYFADEYHEANEEENERKQVC